MRSLPSVNILSQVLPPSQQTQRDIPKLAILLSLLGLLIEKNVALQLAPRIVIALSLSRVFGVK